MVSRTPLQKISSILILVLFGSTGLALAYEYATDLYAIEKLALDDGINWKIKQETSDSPSTFTVSVSASATQDLASKYRVASNGKWTCIVTTSNESNNNLKDKLKESFGNISDIKSDSEIDINLTNFDSTKRKLFLKSCSKNRKPNPNKDTVNSELKLPLTDLEQEIKAVFEGTWINASDTK